MPPLGMNITGVDITQPDPLISTWTEFWSATSGMLILFHYHYICTGMFLLYV